MEPGCMEDHFLGTRVPSGQAAHRYLWPQPLREEAEEGQGQNSLLQAQGQVLTREQRWAGQVCLFKGLCRGSGVQPPWELRAPAPLGTWAFSAGPDVGVPFLENTAGTCPSVSRRPQGWRKEGVRVCHTWTPDSLQGAFN